MTLAIQNLAYHRNGVCGVGFYVVDFTSPDIDGPARAILFPNGDKTPTYYAITTQDPADTWRGDHFIDALWAALNP